MPTPMMPGDAARPIMGYVRELEGKVLTLRAQMQAESGDRRRFRAISFWSGFVLGGGLIMLVLRYLH